jgi:prepilin-type N-terminal cleavage/methylation domain-containing protein
MLIFGTDREDNGIKGFSLVEILTVVVIMSILLTIVPSMFTAFRQRTNLREAAGALTEDMKLAKQRAVAENVNYTITFNVNNNSYEIQSPPNCSGAACTYDVTKNLGTFGSGIVINSQNFVGNIMTAQPRGTLSGIAGTNATVTLKNSLNSTLNINVYPMGRITIQ